MSVGSLTSGTLATTAYAPLGQSAIKNSFGIACPGRQLQSGWEIASFEGCNRRAAPVHQGRECRRVASGNEIASAIPGPPACGDCGCALLARKMLRLGCGGGRTTDRGRPNQRSDGGDNQTTS